MQVFKFGKETLGLPFKGSDLFSSTAKMHVELVTFLDLIDECLHFSSCECFSKD